MEIPKLLERIRLPVEEEVWEKFCGFLREKNILPRSIVLVGDDGKGTLANLAADSYPESKIFIVDRSPKIIERLTPKAAKLGWSVIAGDIKEPETMNMIVQKTSGGADAVFMKHGVHLNRPADQKTVVADLFRLCHRGGIVGWSVPTATVGWRVRPQDAFIDRTIAGGFFHSTVYIGTNTLERRAR